MVGYFKMTDANKLDYKIWKYVYLKRQQLYTTAIILSFIEILERHKKS